MGLAIAEARAVTGQTQTDLADQTGIARTYLARIESGLVTTQLRRTFELFDALGIELTATIPSGH